MRQIWTKLQISPTRFANVNTKCKQGCVVYTVRPTHHSVFTEGRYASAVNAVVVCLFVYPSVTRRYCIKTAKCKITQTTPYDSPETLVFWCLKSRRNSNEVTPNRGAKWRWGRFKQRFSNNVTVCQKRYQSGAISSDLEWPKVPITTPCKPPHCDMMYRLSYLRSAWR